jgi:hypothetical protein
VKNIAHNLAQYILVKINAYVIFTEEKSSPKMWATLTIFKKNTQSKQSPLVENFAQSGHSGRRGLLLRLWKSVARHAKLWIGGAKSLAPRFLNPSSILNGSFNSQFLNPFKILWQVLKSFFLIVANAFISPFNAQTMHIT